MTADTPDPDSIDPPADGLREGPGRPGRVYLLLGVAYLAFVVYGSFVPLRFRHVPLEVAWRAFRHVHWLGLGIGHRADLVANGLLFIPLAFLAMGAATGGGRRRWAGWLFAVIVPLLATLLACGIEFAQVYFPARTRSLNDIIAECVGGVLGTLIWLIWGPGLTRWARALWGRHVRHEQAGRVLILYLAGLAIYQFMPFDLTLSPAEMIRKLRRGQVVFVPFADPRGISAYILCIKAALLLPVGYLIRMVRPRSGVLGSALVGAVVAAVIEAGQLLVYSRFSSATDVVLGALGSGLGGYLAGGLSVVAPRPWLNRPGWRGAARVLAAVACALFLAFLVSVHWSGAGFRRPAEGMWTALGRSLRPPFYHLYRKTEFLALAQMMRRFGSFFVLGVALRAALGASAAARRAGVVTAWVLGFVLEAGQVFVLGRVPDLTTTALFLGAGGTLGVCVAPWLGRLLLAPPNQPPERRLPPASPQRP